MIFSESIRIAANRNDVFSIYAKVDEWALWDTEIESATLQGGFSEGSLGKLKPKGGPESKIKLIEVTDNQSFTVECGLPLCKMHFVHILKNTEAGETEVINELRFTGLLAPLFGRIIGKSISKTMPNSLAGLKKYAESKS